MPKYPEIKATLKGRLLDGAYREGEALPSEAGLAREFGVSRMTARRAVDELEREGYVRRVPGAGSYPTGRRFRQGVFRVAPLEEIAGGADTFTRVLSAGLAAVPPDVAEALGLQPGGAAVSVVRLRGLALPGGEEPLILERRFLRPEAEGVLRRNLAVESLHDLLVEALGLEIVRVEQSLSAVSLEPEEARPLGLAPGRAAFLLRRLSFTREGPFGHARYWLRGDRPVFVGAFEP